MSWSHTASGTPAEALDELGAKAEKESLLSHVNEPARRAIAVALRAVEKLADVVRSNQHVILGSNGHFNDDGSGNVNVSLAVPFTPAEPTAVPKGS